MGRKRRAAEPEPEIVDDEDVEDEDEQDDEVEEAKSDPNGDAIKQLRLDLENERAERLVLKGRLEERESRREAPRAEPEEVVDDTEIDEAIAAGGAKARAVMQKMARIEAQKIAKTFEPAMADMRTKVDGFGLPALARHTAAIESASLTHYTRYKKEIDERLNQLPVETRTQPEAIRQIYALVAGEHLDEIVEERVAAALKKQNGSPGAGPTTIRGRGADDTHVPSAEELWGPAEARMIQSKGGEDAYAKKNGFVDWASMLRETGALEVKGNA